MEISWFRFLNALEISAFEDRGRLRYAVHNPRNGKTYLTNAAMAGILHRIRHLSTQDRSETLDKEEMKLAYGFVQNLREMSKKELQQTPPFNPLFVRFNLIDLGRYDEVLSTVARRIAPYMWPIFTLLFTCCLFLGMTSEWKILQNAQAGLSIAGLASFALVSPFLKIPHELGHALVARTANVHLLSGGVMMVGLYPMPYVDCSMADLQASRRERVKISLAGIFVDIITAMIFFIGWYLVEGNFLKTLCSNIFIFSSLNSLLFNGNPLIKLDGYYALSDWLGHRNLSTSATMMFKKFRLFISSLGAQGTVPTGRRQIAYVIYAFAAMFYKINILLTVLWLVMPRFFGGGLLLALWGGYVLFLSPLFSKALLSKASGGENKMKTKLSMRRLIFPMGSALVIGLCLFIPIPLTTVVQVSLDIENHYGVHAKEAGVLNRLSIHDTLPQNTQIVSIYNLVLDQEIMLAKKRLEAVQLLLGTVSQLDPTQTNIANERVLAAKSEYTNLKQRAATLDIKTTENGYFIPRSDLRNGTYVIEGALLGYFLPIIKYSYLTGKFPEKWIKPLRSSTPKLELWTNREVLNISNSTKFRLVQETVEDAEQGERRYHIVFNIIRSPVDLLGKHMWMKITMGSVPIYAHINYFINDLLKSYREARLQQLS